MLVNTFSAGAKSLFNRIPNLITQQTRTTIILRRKYPLRLHKKEGKPHRFKKTDYIYEVVENTNTRKPKPIDIILTKYVEGFGEKGEKISLSPERAYNRFLLPGLAVYASPDNIKKYLKEKSEKKTYSSPHAPTILKILQKCCLIVHMSIENPWIIEKYHIRANFRKIGIIVTDDSITMPEREISGPNLDNEGKEFYITITINKTEKVIVRCRLHHDSADMSKQLILEPNSHKIPKEAIYPEDQEILDSLPRPQWEEQKIVKKSLIV